MKQHDPNTDRALRMAVRHKAEHAERMTLPKDFADRVMQHIGETKPVVPSPRTHHLWLYPAIGIAASIVLLLLFALLYRGLGTTNKPTLAKQTKVNDTVEHIARVLVRQPIQETPTVAQSMPAPLPKQHQERMASVPDTLGSSIWQSEENMMLALQMLADCEETIEQGERAARNSIIEATFNATPQPANAILVSNEVGDYEVIEPSNMIAI